jgi:two-component system chemotaxis response regulator CheY
MAYRLLIVDDSAAMRGFIGRVLDMTGLEIDRKLEAANGREALQVLERESVDFVLTDINMPVMNGEQMLAALLANESTRGIPVIVVSTDSSECRNHRMSVLGARGYVTKPFSPERLRQEIERSIGALG